MSTIERTTTCPKCGAEIMESEVRCRNCGEVLHKDARKHASTPSTHGSLWSIAFILCLVYASLYFLFVVIMGTWLVYPGGLATPLLLGVVPPLAAFVSVVIARKWELISGVVLTSEFLFLIIWDFIAKRHLTAGTFFSLPFLVAGILFILSWFLSWRRLSKNTA